VCINKHLGQSCVAQKLPEDWCTSAVTLDVTSKKISKHFFLSQIVFAKRAARPYASFFNKRKVKGRQSAAVL
jgi:hypothetical protein